MNAENLNAMACELNRLADEMIKSFDGDKLSAAKMAQLVAVEIASRLSEEEEETFMDWVRGN